MTKVRKSNKKYKSRKNNKKLQKIQKSKKYLYIQLHLTFNMCYEKLSGY